MTNGSSGTAPSYEQARAELAQIVAQLESGGQSLEESLVLWERGEHLADLCQQWLTGAAERLEAALAAADAPPEPTAEPTNAERNDVSAGD